MPYVCFDKKCDLKPPCTWTHAHDDWGDFDMWNTSCGQAHEFTSGNPEDNFHKFCPYCGGELEQVIPEREVEDGV